MYKLKIVLLISLQLLCSCLFYSEEIFHFDFHNDVNLKKTDVKNFTKLALSDPENSSHNQIMDKLFRYGDVIDPFEESKLFDLSDNEHFLRDLGLK